MEQWHDVAGTVHGRVVKTYPIIHIEFLLPSFSWGSGLYAIVENDGETLKMVRIRPDGSPDMYDDGRPMITCTSCKAGDTKKIKETQLFLEVL